MPLPPEYEVQFVEGLNKRSHGDRTARTYRSMFRRMCRDLTEDGARDPATMLWYRWNLAKGSVSIFAAVWSIVRQTEVGMSIPPSIEKPRVMYPHPLYADVMHLGSIYGNDRLTDMKWPDVEGNFLFDERAVGARRRIFEWFMGSDATPDEKTPLVVCDRAASPMQLWQVEAIINSSVANKDHQRKYKREAIAPFMTEAIAILTRLNASAAQLREACDHIAQIGEHSELFLFKDALADLRACATADELLEVVRLFPQDHYDEMPKLW